MRAAVLLTSSLSMATVGFAQDMSEPKWVRIGVLGTGYTVFLDTESIERSGSVASFQTRGTKRKASQTILWELNCESSQIRLTYLKVEGVIEGIPPNVEEFPNAPWEPIPSGGLTAKFSQHVCPDKATVERVRR